MDARQRLLQEARTLRSFQQEAEELHHWVQSLQERLLQEGKATDVASAMASLEQHQELQLELEEQRSRYRGANGHNQRAALVLHEVKVFGPFRLKEMENLGKVLQQGERGGSHIEQTLDSLSAGCSRAEALWLSRRQQLEQEVELQRLNQEADRIQAAVSGHQARLKLTDAGVSWLWPMLSSPVVNWV